MNYKSFKFRIKLYLLTTLSIINIYKFGEFVGECNEKKETYKKLKEEQSILVSFEQGTLYNDLKIYDIYLDEVVNCINNYNMSSNPFDVYTIYNYMKKNGLLSYGDIFLYEENESELLSNLGVTIPYGNGVCRNQAYNLYDIFTKLGYTAYMSTGEAYYKKEDAGITNHAVCGVEYKNKIYLFDPTNDTVLVNSGSRMFKGVYNQTYNYKLDPYMDDVYGFKEENRYLYNYISLDNILDKKEVNDYMEKSNKKLNVIKDYLPLYESIYLEDIEKEFIDSLDLHISNLEGIKKYLK